VNCQEIESVLPRQGATLEYNYVNAPFNTSIWSILNLGNRLINYREQINNTPYYTRGKSVKVKSNGINGLFDFDYNLGQFTIESPINIITRDIKKESVANIPYPSIGPLNMSELSIYLADNGLLAYSHIYTEVQKKSKFPLSNLITLSTLESITYERTSNPLELTSPLATLKVPTDNSILNIKLLKDSFLCKDNTFSALSIINDNTLSVIASTIELVDPTLTDGYNGTIKSFRDLTSELYGRGGERVSLSGINGATQVGELLPSLYIVNPLMQDSPANKQYIDSVATNYVSGLNPIFNNTIVEQNEEYHDNSVMSIGEAKKHISAYFDKITTNAIGSITEFKRYIDGVCVSDYSEFMDYTFSIKGGKIYNGFDYESKYSILNSQALRSILVETTGKYTKDMHQVYSATIYFTDMTKTNKLSAYAQKLGFPFDIATDTIGQVFQQIRGVVNKLCVMSPDVVPEDEDPVIPEFKATAFFSAPSIYPSFSPWFGRSTLIKPLYFKSISLYVSSPPNIGAFQGILASTFLNKPNYIEPQEDGMIVSPPHIGSFSPSINIDSIESPIRSLENGTMVLFKKEDPYDPYMSVFATSENCSNRHKMDSYRQINMMEVSVVASALLSNSMSSKYYFYSNTEDFVLLKSQFLLMILSDVFCKLDGRVNMRMTVDLNTLSAIVENGGQGQGQGSSSTNCAANNSGEVAISTLSEGTSNIVVMVNGQEITSAGIVTGTKKLTLTEIIGNIDTSTIDFSWGDRYGSEAYRTNIDALTDTLTQLVLEYENGKIYSSSTPIIDNNITVASLANISKGCLLSEYIVGFTGGINKKATTKKYGIFEDIDNVAPTTLINYASSYSNVVIGSSSASPLVNRRDNIVNPMPGQKEIKVWKPLYAAYSSNVNTLPYLGLSENTQAVFSLYGPIVLIYKESNITYFDPIGVDVEIATEVIAGEIYHIMTAVEAKIVLHKTSEGGTPVLKVFTRDYCDEWVSPFTDFGQVSMGKGALSPLISQGGQERENLISNISTSMIHNGGCDAVLEKTGASGISPTNINNISDLASLDPNSPEQEEGDVPGAYTFSLKMKATKYAPFMSGEEIINRVESTHFTLCITLGVIDGIFDDGGDILAQGYTQEEVPTSGGTPVVYVAPHPMIREHLTVSRITVGGYEASKYTISIADIVSTKLIDDSSGELFVRFFDIAEDEWTNASVKISSLSEKQEESTPFRTVLLGDLRSPGGVFSYKHAGQDPARPVITGYAGSTEVDFIHGTRLVGTTFTPIPLSTYTEADSADSFIPSLDLTVNTIHFFINNETIEVVVRDTKAVFSENRTIKIVME
jgi:hypothetical protein